MSDARGIECQHAPASGGLWPASEGFGGVVTGRLAGGGWLPSAVRPGIAEWGGRIARQQATWVAGRP